MSAELRAHPYLKQSARMLHNFRPNKPKKRQSKICLMIDKKISMISLKDAKAWIRWILRMAHSIRPANLPLSRVAAAVEPCTYLSKRAAGRMIHLRLHQRWRSDTRWLVKRQARMELQEIHWPCSKCIIAVCMMDRMQRRWKRQGRAGCRNLSLIFPQSRMMKESTSLWQKVLVPTISAHRCSATWIWANHSWLYQIESHFCKVWPMTNTTKRILWLLSIVI